MAIEVSRKKMITQLRRRLSGPQVLAAEMLARGTPAEEVADYVGMHTKTIKFWRCQVLFRTLYKALLEDQRALATQIIHSSAPALAEKIIRTALRSKNEKVALEAALRLLKGTNVLVEGQRLTVAAERPRSAPGVGKEDPLLPLQRAEMVGIIIAKPVPQLKEAVHAEGSGRSAPGDVVDGTAVVVAENAPPAEPAGVG